MNDSDSQFEFARRERFRRLAFWFTTAAAVPIIGGAAILESSTRRLPDFAGVILLAGSFTLCLTASIFAQNAISFHARGASGLIQAAAYFATPVLARAVPIDHPVALLLILPFVAAYALGFAAVSHRFARREARAESEFSPDTTICPVCSYSLIGLRESRCPECGKPFPPEWLLSAANRAQK